MSKKAISNRYAIEYTHPASTASKLKGPGKGLLFTIIIGILLLILGFFYKNGDLSNYVKDFVSTITETKTEIKSNIKDYNSSNIGEQTNPSTASVVDASVEEKPTTDKTENKSIDKAVEAFISSSKPTPNSVSQDSDDSGVAISLKTPPSDDSNQTPDKIEKPIQTGIANPDDSGDNNELLANLDQLTEALLHERKKNTDLENKIKENQDNNDTLSKMLTESLIKKPETETVTETKTKIKTETVEVKKVVKTNDDQYLSALQNVNKNEDEMVLEINAAMTKDSRPDNSIATSKTITAVEATEEMKQELKNNNNSISLSMKSQVDAIINAMKSGNNYSRNIVQDTEKPKAKVNSKESTASVDSTGLQTQNSDLISQLSEQMNGTSETNQDDDNDLIAVNLKGKINQLVSSRKRVSSNYEKALNQESNVRSNAVRSIIVKKGETLWGIAKRAYGDGKHYTKILKANPQITKNKPFRLIVGQVIRVPE